MGPAPTETPRAQEQTARAIRDQLPAGGLFAGQTWRISPTPFPLEARLARQIEKLGRVLLQFNRAANLLYRQSLSGKAPPWVAQWLDQGKPSELIELQRAAVFKSAVPRVIRPDILITDHGLSITELDSVPGGIGLTAWLNQAYASLGGTVPAPIGGSTGMLEGFRSIFGNAAPVWIVVSQESGVYRPEMDWISHQLGSDRFRAVDETFQAFQEGGAVYRFFELFDLANVANAKRIFDLALEKKLELTPPPKTFLEEKMLLALLWNHNLRPFWRRELGESFFAQMLELVPYSWVVDPGSLPPHGAIPELGLTDWNQMKSFSQKERDLILKVSGYSETAWGARGVFLGSDLPAAEWSAAIDLAIASFPRSPFILQRYHKPKTIDAPWFDFESNELKPMAARVRLCPYYFVAGEGDAARAQLGGILATICPADKKIIHGMTDAILAPCSVANEEPKRDSIGKVEST